jgi:hypothetical protein
MAPSEAIYEIKKSDADKNVKMFYVQGSKANYSLQTVQSLLYLIFFQNFHKSINPS